ncbi:hypothetical protein PCANB_000450 [Pneumocystis canis]|nr:hypothetical protein PCANB_000450 [Pneumocystis canis]
MSTLHVSIDSALPTSALQVEELTPTLIFPRETCLDILSKHSLCSTSEQDIYGTNHFSNLQNGFLKGYVSFPSLELYSQDKRSTSIRN